MRKPLWPRFPINSALIDFLAGTRLLTLGITDAKSYFHVWPTRIVVWVIVCAIVGAWNGGLGGMVCGALIGLAMPLMLMYLSIILPMVMAPVAGIFLRIAWALFCLWLLVSLLFG